MTPSPAPAAGPAPRDPDRDPDRDPPHRSSSDPPRYTVSAVARRLGVAPATLRTWARRYGLGPSEHTSGAHRRYSTADLARLQRMRRLTLSGVAPADAARFALADDTAPAEEPPQRAGGPGGPVLALPAGVPAARGLARAVMALDDGAVTGLLREQVGSLGVVAAWDTVLAPVLVAVGQRWAATGKGVDVEHLLSECAATVLRESAAARTPAGAPRPALLACVENDQHALPLTGLAAALAERGVAARVLGAAVPTPALVAAVRRTGPVALFLWSQMAATAATDALRALPAMRPAATVVVGGPGWQPADLPERVVLADALAQATELVAAATGR